MLSRRAATIRRLAHRVAGDPFRRPTEEGQDPILFLGLPILSSVYLSISLSLVRSHRALRPGQIG